MARIARSYRTARALVTLIAWQRRAAQPLMAPVHAFRLAYLPLLAIHAASGGLGLVAVAESFWIKGSLSLSAAELASIAVWLQLPWSLKMVVGELVDSVEIAGSRRRSYLVIGAGLMAFGLLLLAGAASGQLALARPETLYVAGQLAIVMGAVIQEVVADAMSAEVVALTDAEGRAREKVAIENDMAMVQVLARLAYSIGAFIAAALSGVLAKSLSYGAVYLCGLVLPALSLVAAMVIAAHPAGTARSIDPAIAWGGLALAAGAAAIGLAKLPFAEELVLAIALGVIVTLLRRVMAGVPADVARAMVAVAVMAFAFRAVPTLGEGYRWYVIDRLGFDERFFGVLQLTGTGIGIAAMWLLTGVVMRRPARSVMLWLTAAAALLWLPSLALVAGVHEWTQAALGIGPRTIALFDEAAQSPLGLLAIVPFLTLIALHAPVQTRATFFALAASLMSLAIMASAVLTKHLNQVFAVERGVYEALLPLVASVLAISIVMPLAAIAAATAMARRTR